MVQALHIEPCWPCAALKASSSPLLPLRSSLKLSVSPSGLLYLNCNSIRDAQNSAKWSPQTWFRLNHPNLLTGAIFRFQDGRASWRSSLVESGWLKSNPISFANPRSTSESWIDHWTLGCCYLCLQQIDWYNDANLKYLTWKTTTHHSHFLQKMTAWRSQENLSCHCDTLAGAKAFHWLTTDNELASIACKDMAASIVFLLDVQVNCHPSFHVFICWDVGLCQGCTVPGTEATCQEQVIAKDDLKVDPDEVYRRQIKLLQRLPLAHLEKKLKNCRSCLMLGPDVQSKFALLRAISCDLCNGGVEIVVT